MAWNWRNMYWGVFPAGWNRATSVSLYGETLGDQYDRLKLSNVANSNNRKADINSRLLAAKEQEAKIVENAIDNMSRQYTNSPGALYQLVRKREQTRREIAKIKEQGEKIIREQRVEAEVAAGLVKQAYSGLGLVPDYTASMPPNMKGPLLPIYSAIPDRAARWPYTGGSGPNGLGATRRETLEQLIPDHPAYWPYTRGWDRTHPWMFKQNVRPAPVDRRTLPTIQQILPDHTVSWPTGLGGVRPRPVDRRTYPTIQEILPNHAVSWPTGLGQAKPLDKLIPNHASYWPWTRGWDRTHPNIAQQGLGQIFNPPYYGMLLPPQQQADGKLPVPNFLMHNFPKTYYNSGSYF